MSFVITLFGFYWFVFGWFKCMLYDKQNNAWVGNRRFISQAKHDMSFVRYHVQHLK